jgi:hypothetical protein
LVRTTSEPSGTTGAGRSYTSWAWLPALMVVDKTGRVVYKHYGSSMSDIPPIRQILAVLDELNQEEDRSG